MEKWQYPGYNMILSTYNFLWLRRRYFSHIPAFNESMEKLANRLRLINEIFGQDALRKDALHNNLSKGLSGDKELEARKRSLVCSLIKISGAICLYCREAGMEQMHSSMDLSEYDMMHLRHSILTGTALNALDFARSFRDKLSRYGILNQDIKELETNISLFREMIHLHKPEMNRFSIGALRELKVLIAEMDHILEQELDRFTVTIKQRNPDVYREYMTARKFPGINIS